MSELEIQIPKTASIGVTWTENLSGGISGQILGVWGPEVAIFPIPWQTFTSAKMDRISGYVGFQDLYPRYWNGLSAPTFFPDDN